MRGDNPSINYDYAKTISCFARSNGNTVNILASEARVAKRRGELALMIRHVKKNVSHVICSLSAKKL